MPTIPNIDYLASELSPYLMAAVPDIATGLASKSAEVAAAASIRGLRSISTSLARRFRRIRASSKAYAAFEKRWLEAATPAQREKAIRNLLSEEPSFAASLEMLLLRRDYVIATASYCDRFPALDQDRMLSDSYVPISIRSLTARAQSAAPFVQSDISTQGNHIIVGDGGSGKSTFLRYLARAEAEKLLQDRHEVAFDDVRLPCLIRAADLAGSVDIATALHRAVTSSLGGRLRRPLPSDFFVANAADGHRNWLILVDGLDEIEGSQRRDAWDVIRLHAQQESGFRFILSTRPEAVAPTSGDDAFSHWAVEQVSEAGQEAFAASYLSDAALRSRFLELLAQREYRYIAGVPLFLAMSGQLFAKTRELHGRTIDLYEHYIAQALEKATAADASKMAALSELLCLVAMNEGALAKLVRERHSLVQTLAGSFSAFGAEDALGKLLERTALVRCSDKGCTFSHELFRSYYRALELAKQYGPGPGILREVEPFREGWAVVEQLMLRWDRDGLNIESTLRSLLEYGDDGLQCAAHIIAAARGEGHDKVAVGIAERLLRESRDTGPTVLADRILPLLAEASPSARDLLIEQLDYKDFLSDTFIAGCLLNAGELDEALDHLLWVAGRDEGYSPDRIDAAELLLKHGYREEALDTLRDVAANSDEYWSMVDAASILYERERTAENRRILADLCAVDTSNSRGRIYSSTLSRLMTLGEVELALPHLESATRRPEEASKISFDLCDAIEAAKSIALHHHRLEGMRSLEAMLTSCEEMREKTQVARALADLGFDQAARSILRSGLEANELQIDWLTVDLLIRLDMTEEARSAVEAAVSHLLDGRHHISEALDLIRHALPVLDRRAMSAFILSHAQVLKEPRLARSLALLGAPEDARSLLSDFLTYDDTDLQINAAGALCELGDAQLGRRKLCAIARDRNLIASDRLMAAEQLKDVGLLRHAAVAFARVARDDSVEVSQRTRAAFAFDQLEHHRNHIVWEPLADILEDRAQPVVDRVAAAETLIRIDGEDGYDDLVYPQLFAMLDDDALSDRDILRVGALLGKCGWRLDKMPRVRRVLGSEQQNPRIKIKTLRAIGRYGENSEVAPFLIQIAAHPTASVELVLEALDAIWHHGDNDEAQSLLGQIARDTAVPPAWRLKAATKQRADLQLESLLLLAEDNSIDIASRLEALEALPPDKRSAQEALLLGIADSIDMSSWDRRKIAEAADRLQMLELRDAVIQSAKDDQPLSIWEMIELSKLCRELGDEAGAEQMLRELLTLPLIVLTSSEDTSVVIEGIQLTAALDQELAVTQLKGMLLSEDMSWWSLAEVLEAYVELVGREVALIDAASIIEQLSAGLRSTDEGEYSGWTWHAEKFLKLGFYRDYDALIAFAENGGNRISERAAAYGLIIKYADAASALRSVAQNSLKRLLRSELSPSEQILIAQELHRLDCHAETKEWLNQCLSNTPTDPEDIRNLAQFLRKIGRDDKAKILAESISAAELVKGHLFPTDKDSVKSVLDDEVTDDALFKQILDDDDTLDQIWCAREYVDEHGDHRALKLILEAATGNDDEDEPHRQLDAIDCLDQLGFRKLSRDLFAAMPKAGIEPYWFGAQLLRFGKKSEAVPFYVESSCSKLDYNENLVWDGLAELRLIPELMKSRSQPGLAVSG